MSRIKVYNKELNTWQYADVATGVGGAEIFIAEFGVTTAQEITDALESGKYVYCVRDYGTSKRMTYYVRDDENQYIFSATNCAGLNNVFFSTYINKDNDTWGTSYKNVSNEFSTNDEANTFSTTKATRDYLDANAIMANKVQTLTDEQKAQAQKNIGIGDIQKSLDALWKVNKGQTWDIEQREETGHAQLPSGGEYGDIDEIYGKTEQESTNGYNLIDNAKMMRQKESYGYHVATESGFLFDYDGGDGQIPDSSGRFATVSTDYLKAGETIHLSFRFENKGSTEVTRIGTMVKYTDGSSKYSIEDKTITLSGDVKELHLYIEISEWTSGVLVEIYDLMLEKGTVAHDYEPYTGGIPSPNPDYPQEIVSVESIEVKKTGSNLAKEILNGYPNSGGYYQANADVSSALFYAIKGKTYMIGSDSASQSRNTIAYWKELPSVIRSGIYFDEQIGSISSPFVAPYTGWYVWYFSNTVVDDLYVNIGEHGTGYEPYREEIRTIIPPRPLNAIEEYRDKMDAVNGVWVYTVKEITNASVSSLQSVNSHGIANFAITGITDGLSFSKGLKFLSDYFTESQTLAADTTIPCMLRNSNGASFVRFDSSKISTVTQANEWMSANAPKTIYVTKVPDTEPIDPTDLEWLRSLELKDDENLFITDNHGRDVSYLMTDFINLGKVGG